MDKNELLEFMREHMRLRIDTTPARINYDQLEPGSITVEVVYMNPETERDEVIWSATEYT